MPTIGAQLQLLAPKEQTKRTAIPEASIYQVAKGRGWSVIGGQRFDWEEKDIFALPSWTPHSHAQRVCHRGRGALLLQRLPRHEGARPLP